MGGASETQRRQKTEPKPHRPVEEENCNTGLLPRKVASYTFSNTMWTWKELHTFHSSKGWEIRM